jgi:hypothetical protein|tara:strand:+ start:492 stop:767 length:276 start_codon:yes stop_codon:yes gene_type:complete
MKNKWLAIILLGAIGFMCSDIYNLRQKINIMHSMNADLYRQVNDNSMMLDSITEQIPPEVERISRRVAKEEGIKLFKKFSENFNNLTQEGK